MHVHILGICGTFMLCARAHNASSRGNGSSAATTAGSCAAAAIQESNNDSRGAPQSTIAARGNWACTRCSSAAQRSIGQALSSVLEMRRRLPRMRAELPAGWRDIAAQVRQELCKQSAPQATRASSQAALNIIGPALPEIFAGSADLTPSNNTLFKGAVTLTPGKAEGNYLHYGVREFGMQILTVALDPPL